MDAKTFLESHVPLFAGLSDEHLIGLAESSELKPYKAGQTILFTGMTVDGLHVVAVGKVSIHSRAAGKGVVKVAELGPGEIFGETSILEDGTYVLVIPQDAFRRVVAESPDFVARLKALMVARIPPPRT